MRALLKVGKWLLAIVIFLVVAVAGWLYQSPPELIGNGSAYSPRSSVPTWR